MKRERSLKGQGKIKRITRHTQQKWKKKMDDYFYKGIGIYWMNNLTKGY